MLDGRKVPDRRQLLHKGRLVLGLDLLLQLLNTRRAVAEFRGHSHDFFGLRRMPEENHVQCCFRHVSLSGAPCPANKREEPKYDDDND